MITKISKGLQITIPANVREKLGLDIGSILEIKEEKGRLILEPIKEDLEEVFKKTKNLKPRYKMTAEEMDEYNERLFR